MAINIPGFFTEFRAVLDALEQVHTAQTDVSTDVDAVYAAMPTDSDTLAQHQQLLSQQRSFVSSSTMLVTLAARISERLQAIVAADGQPANGETEAALELIRQMVVAGDTVKESVVSAAVSPPSDTGAPQLIVSDRGPEGDKLEQMIPDLIVGSYASTVTLALAGNPATTDRLSKDWPTGNGVTATLILAESIVPSPTFNTEADRPDTPDGWIVEVGTIGTTIGITDPEVQTITIAGDPSSGHYTLKFTDIAGNQQTTRPIQWDSGSATVQSRLRELTGLENIEVVESGTSPNFTHTVTFTLANPAGDHPLVIEANNFDQGTITVAETTPGETANDGYACRFTSNGVENTRILVRIDQQLTASAQYAGSVQMRRSAGLVAGTLRISLVDGTYALTTDAAGAGNAVDVDLSGLSDAKFNGQPFIFRTPADLPPYLYLSLELTTPHTSTEVLYLDDVLLAEMQQLTDGPYVLLAPNQREVQTDDRYELTAANNRAGRLQDWYGRIFGLQLPSATSGSETISDT